MHTKVLTNYKINIKTARECATGVQGVDEHGNACSYIELSESYSGLNSDHKPLITKWLPGPIKIKPSRT